MTFSVLPILCASAPRAFDRVFVCGFLFFPKIWGEDFATVRAIYYSFFHMFHLLPNYVLEDSPKKKKGKRPQRSEEDTSPSEH
jgi:hypothetical protein